MQTRYLSVAATIVAAFATVPATASTFLFDFAGSGVTGSVTLTYAPNPNVGGPLGTSPNTVDPVGSYIITGATGKIKDAKLGLVTTITGVVPSSPGAPSPGNLLAPASFGHYIITEGVPGPDGVAPGFSYDNLFYPDGSPQTATDYPFHGGFLDIYGLVFTTAADGFAVNFWSNGDLGGGVTYGAGVTNGTEVLDYVGDISVSAAVPEPATWAMMLVGFGLIGAAARYRRRRTAIAFA